MSESPPEPPVQEVAAPTLPVEEPGRPFLPGLFDTVKLLALDPMGGFARMSLKIDLTKPLLYGLILAWFGTLVQFLWGLAVQSGIMGFLAQIEGVREVLPAMLLGVAGGTFGVLIAPVFILLWIFIWTAIVHLFLMMVGGDTQGFTATLRVVFYSQTAQVAQVVPFFGDLIATLWGLILCIIGVAAAHRTTTGKAAAAVLLPIVLCCVCVGIGLMMALMMGLALD
jgi:hypothetical protein